jgi:hypothetical protein
MSNKKRCHFIAKSTGKPCRQPPSQNENEDHNYCHWHQSGGHSYFRKYAELRNDEKKWCRCVLHVAAKQSDTCLEDVNNNAEKILDGKICYNPYAICSKSIGTSSRQCSINYAFENIPDDELIAYSKIKKIKVPIPYSRGKMIEAIMEWKKREKK